VPSEHTDPRKSSLEEHWWPRRATAVSSRTDIEFARARRGKDRRRLDAAAVRGIDLASRAAARAARNTVAPPDA